MALDAEKTLWVEEIKEVGHEYRYRDQLMVQEFGLAMTAAGILLSIITQYYGTLLSVILQCFGFAFLALLTIHLDNIDQDRRTALTRKRNLYREIGFSIIHQNDDGWRRTGIPRAIIWFTGIATFAWAVGLLFVVYAALMRFLPQLN